MIDSCVSNGSKNKEGYSRVNCSAVGLGGSVAALCSPTVTGDNPDVDKIYAIDIPQSNADQALKTLAHQTGVQVLVPFDLVKAIDTRPISGNYSVMTALAVLLYNTGLSGILTDSGVITISLNGSEYESNQNGKGKSMNITNSTKRKTLLAGLVGVFAAGGMTQAVAQGGEAATGQSAIDEIIVTANKREQSLQDTAMSISVLSQETIGKKNLVGMNDYLRTLPGVNMIDYGVGQNAIIIRGVSADPQLEGFNTGTTVGVYFGEAPVSGYALGNTSDIKLVDIERVEVLKGPQGTLYGSGSLAGTVRNIPVAPKIDDFEGRISIGLSDTNGTGDMNSEVKGVLNLPLVDDRLAMRLVAYRYENDGYIDNIAGSDSQTVANALSVNASHLAVDEDDVGASGYDGFRISTLFQVTEDLSVSLSYLNQDLEQQGLPESNLDLGRFKQARLRLGDVIGGRERLANGIEVVNFHIEYDLSWASLISSSSWLEEELHRHRDIGSFFGGIPFPQVTGSNAEVFAEELRLSSRLDGPVQFVAGLYYEDSDTSFTELSYWGWRSST